MRIHFVINPISGQGRRGLRPNQDLFQARYLLDRLMGLNVWGRAAADAWTRGAEPEWGVLVTTPEKSDLQRGFRDILNRSVDPIHLVVVGGDGTHRDVAQVIWELVEEGTRGSIADLTLLPAGRGNDLIRGVTGYSGPGEDGPIGYLDWIAARAEKPGDLWSVREMDLGLLRDFEGDGIQIPQVFLNMVSVGYGGAIVRNVGAGAGFFSTGKLAYQVEGARAFFREPAIGCRIRTCLEGGESGVHHGPVFAAFIGNGRANGGGLFWTPAARPDDQKLDLIWFDRPGMIQMVGGLSAVKLQRDPPFPHRRAVASEHLFEFERDVFLEADGEFLGQSRKFAAVLLPRAIRLRLPSFGYKP